MACSTAWIYSTLALDVTFLMRAQKAGTQSQGLGNVIAGPLHLLGSWFPNLLKIILKKQLRIIFPFRIIWY